MVGTTLREELTNQEIDEKELPSAECEPKMTRSRAKEVMENEKNVLHPWPLYPLKKKKAPGILELTFSEDDEDEEYTPEKDQCKGEEDADEQMASRTRSKFSLTDKSLTELEADFIDPDITVDLDNTECDDKECECDDKECECDDKEWKEFLFSIHKSDS
ncbi:hypothetical protein ACJMK2_044160 [Sinanodonta woodiana]|uniref:Uncharacterized protein n=1 Tax=Sinanodonta woodiana TaxID=1069815 RepID=A0ABD3VZQ8_SINWO